MWWNQYKLTAASITDLIKTNIATTSKVQTWNDTYVAIFIISHHEYCHIGIII